ncbi:hypothetical protein AMIS_73670 [Actinoplanes missouriensis 431]|uniref:Uncharacterized protein n=1 Tax=Actinoplanes missouriensis (strain ATCC 14538 / DSM 43046 / CBS 188.64 / JCM 3121 / NBRC 102363 / NCIMB 12654 / NRRL B-3342 / UNCC 431) TaxID=512565 RepID=I0HHV0_ACTM4|nr:hypothetical protein [Actinoplanes missouriensis]BAL92587.1 hypothetical protein AMIS_73670 [Actinoplanes missouriensis 431]
MRQQRWFRIAVLAAGLFVINAVARLVVRFGYDGSDSAQNRASIVMFALIALILGVLTFLRSQHVRSSTWLPEIGFGALGGMLLTVLVGPFLSGSSPFANGAGDFFAQVWIYAACAIVGSALGFGVAVMLGRDYRSKSLAAFTRARTTRPRRVVRR